MKDQKNNEEPISKEEMAKFNENITTQAALAFQPYYDRVLVKKDPEATETESGLKLSKRTREKPMQGTVVAHGPDMRFVEVGTRVCFNKDAGIDILIDGQEYTFMIEKQLLGGY